MNITPIKHVQDASARALAMCPSKCPSSAIRAAAQALCLPVEAVRDVVEAKEGQPT